MMFSAWPSAFVQDLFFWSRAAKNEKRMEVPPSVGLRVLDQGRSGNAGELWKRPGDQCRMQNLRKFAKELLSEYFENSRA
jgi:hypothetical protein